MELSDFDDAAVARANLGDGLVVVDEVSLSLLNVVRLGVMYVLVPAYACARRKYHPRVHSAVT